VRRMSKVWSKERRCDVDERELTNKEVAEYLDCLAIDTSHCWFPDKARNDWEAALRQAKIRLRKFDRMERKPK